MGNRKSSSLFSPSTEVTPAKAGFLFGVGSSVNRSYPKLLLAVDHFLMRAALHLLVSGRTQGSLGLAHQNHQKCAKNLDDGNPFIAFVKHGKFATFLPRGGS